MFWFCMSTANSRILRHPEEYDDQIPNVTLADFVIERMREFGDDISCVIKKKISNIMFLAVNMLMYKQL